MAYSCFVGFMEMGAPVTGKQRTEVTKEVRIKAEERHSKVRI